MRWQTTILILTAVVCMSEAFANFFSVSDYSSYADHFDDADINGSWWSYSAAASGYGTSSVQLAENSLFNYTYWNFANYNYNLPINDGLKLLYNFSDYSKLANYTINMTINYSFVSGGGCISLGLYDYEFMSVGFSNISSGYSTPISLVGVGSYDEPNVNLTYNAAYNLTLDTVARTVRYVNLSDGSEGVVDISSLGDNALYLSWTRSHDQTCQAVQGNPSFGTLGVDFADFEMVDLIELDYPLFVNYALNTSTPHADETVYLWANVSDNESISECNFTLAAPDGTYHINNENGTFDERTWNTSDFNLNQSGTYLYNITCYDLSLRKFSTTVSDGFAPDDTTPASITLTDPNGTYDSKSNIPLRWSSNELLKTCYYTIDNGSSNTTISCSNTTFSVGSNDYYELYFFGEDYESNLGEANSSFTVNEVSNQTGGPGGSGGAVTIVEVPVIGKNLGEPCLEDKDCASGICYQSFNDTESLCQAGLCGNNECDRANGEDPGTCAIDCAPKAGALLTGLAVAGFVMLVSSILLVASKNQKKNKRRYET